MTAQTHADIQPDPAAKPAYFRAEGAHFIPTPHALSPWDPKALAGGPVSMLLATIAQQNGPPQGFEITRFTVDILGKVRNAPLRVECSYLRDGRQTKFQRVLLYAAPETGETLVAQAMLVWARQAATPSFPDSHVYPLPDALKKGHMPGHSGMDGAIEVRPAIGDPQSPGPSASWLKMDGEVIAGQPASPFAKAALFADFGNGFGAATSAHDWSFANLDITLQLLRQPVGEWILLDAKTHMAGNGHGTARNIFSDEKGVFARGFQSVFVAPGAESVTLPPRLDNRGTA